MSDRKGSYLTRPGRASAPVSLVSVVVTTDHDRELGGSAAVAEATFRQAFVCVTRRVRDHWTPTTELAFGDAGAFWLWLDEWARAGRRTMVVSPVASDSLTLLGFWGMVDRAGAVWQRGTGGEGSAPAEGCYPDPYTFRRLVLSGSPDIIDYTHKRKSYLWVSGRNYFPDDPAELLAPPGDADGPQPRQPADPPGLWPDPARDRCRNWLSAVRRLCDWWVGRDAGQFAATAGALGDRFLRSRMKGPKPCTHSNDDAKRLERLAAHRGRTQTWYFGSVVSDESTPDDELCTPRGPFGTIESRAVHIDVRSCYPYLLSVTDLPVKILTHMSRCDPDQLKGICTSCVCTASVVIESDAAEYPHRGRNGIDYPTGRFTSYLSGQELVRALHDGAVVKVNAVTVYQRGRPFAAAAAELLALRKSAIQQGEYGWELFVKCLSNSLTGKFAQRRTRWVERRSHPPLARWGEWPELDADTGAVRRFRARAGLVWEKVAEEGGRGTMVAVYGHLTAACSALTRRMREACPPRSVLSLDTDGFWCLPECVDALQTAGFVFGTEPGQLRVTKSSEFTRFWGPKHYFAGREWRLSGLHDPHRLSDGFQFIDSVRHNPVRQSPRSAPDRVADTLRTVNLSLTPSGGGVGPDGWHVPRRLPEPLPAAAPAPAACEEPRDQPREHGHQRLWTDDA